MKNLNDAKKLLQKNRPDEALELLKKISAEDKNNWRVHELIGLAFHDLCDAEGVARAYFNAMMCDEILRSQRTHFSNYLFALHYLPNVDAEILQHETKSYNSLYRDVEQFKNFSPPSEKIHVAFIAPHFLDSSAARFYESLLTDYDRDKFFVTAWSMSSREDDFTKKIRRSVDGFFDISEISFEESAEKIYSVGTDILFDLGGHTEGGITLQVVAYRPAKIQMSGIGYFDTTGLDAIDFFVTDKFLTGGENYFSEKILTLENAFAFKPNKKMIDAKKNLKKIRGENFTFGVLNNFMKITDEFLNTVRQILFALPDAKIIFRDTTPLQSRKNVLAEKIKLLGLPSERVKIFCGEDNFFDDYSKIDLMLDTFPYTGGMMTALSLYMGVPVLNLCGKIHSQRLGADMLKICGAEKFICKDIDEYTKKAIEFSKLDGENIFVDKLTDTRNFVENFYKKISST